MSEANNASDQGREKEPSAPAQPAAPVPPSAPEQPAAPAAPEPPAVAAPPPPPVPAAPTPPPVPVAPEGYTYQQPPQPTGTPQPGSGKATVALICGILAIVSFFLPLVGVALGIVALVLSSQYVRAFGKNGKSTGSKVCGIVGIALSAIAFFLYIAVGIGTLLFVGSELSSISSSQTPISESWSDPSGTPESSDASEPSGEADKKALEEAAVAALDRVESLDPLTLQILANGFEEGFSEGAGYSFSELGIDSLEFAEWLTGATTCSVTDVYINSDGTGEAFIETESRDVASFQEILLQDIADFAASPDSSTLADEAALKAKVGELLLAAMDKTGTASNLLVIEFNKVGSSWIPDPDSLEDAVGQMFTF